MYSILAWYIQNRAVFWGSVPDPAGCLRRSSDPLVVRGFSPSVIAASSLRHLQFSKPVEGKDAHHLMGNRGLCYHGWSWSHTKLARRNRGRQGRIVALATSWSCCWGSPWVRNMRRACIEEALLERITFRRAPTDRLALTSTLSTLNDPARSVPAKVLGPSGSKLGLFL